MQVSWSKDPPNMRAGAKGNMGAVAKGHTPEVVVRHRSIIRISAQQSSSTRCLFLFFGFESLIFVSTSFLPFLCLSWLMGLNSFFAGEFTKYFGKLERVLTFGNLHANLKLKKSTLRTFLQFFFVVESGVEVRNRF